MNWNDIPGWFQWRSAQGAAAHWFSDGSRFVEVGDSSWVAASAFWVRLSKHARKRIAVIGVDTCRGSGIEGPLGKNYHGAVVAEGGGTFVGSTS